MFDLGDKKVTRSLTVIAAVVFAAVQAAEGLGQVPPGTVAGLAIAAKALATVLFGYGVRRAISTNGLSALLYDLDTDVDGDALDEQAEDYVLTDEDFVDAEEEVFDDEAGERTPLSGFPEYVQT